LTKISVTRQQKPHRSHLKPRAYSRQKATRSPIPYLKKFAALIAI